MAHGYLCQAGEDIEVRQGISHLQDRLCRSGYLGRAGIFELLPVDNEVRRQIVEKVTAGDIKQRAMEKGMRTLLADGRRKVLEGRTTIEELVRVCQRDEI